MIFIEVLREQQSDLGDIGHSPEMRKQAKYERILKLIEDKSMITLEICRKIHPEISSGTFHSTMNTLSKQNLVEKIPLDKKRLSYRKTDKYTVEKGAELLKAHFRKTREKHKKEGITPKPLQTKNELTVSESPMKKEWEGLHEAKRRIHNLVEEYMHVLVGGKRRSFNEERVRIAFVLPLLEALGWKIFDETENAELDDATSFAVGTPDTTKILVEVESPNKSLDEYRITREGPKSRATLAIQHAWDAKADWVILTNFEETRLYNSKVKRPEDGLVWKIRFTDYESRFDELAIISREKVLSRALKVYETKIEKPSEYDQITDLLKNEGPLTRRQILEKLDLSRSYQFPWFIRKFGSRRCKVYYLEGQEEMAREKYEIVLKPKRPTPKHPTLAYPKEYFLKLLNLKRTTSFSPAPDGTPVWWERRANRKYTCSTCKRYIEKGEKYIGRKRLIPGMRGIYGYRGTYVKDYYHIMCLLREAQAQTKESINDMLSEINRLEDEITGFREEATSKGQQIDACQDLIQEAREDYELASFWRRIGKWFSYHYTSWSKSNEISRLEKEMAHIENEEIPERKTRITGLKGRISNRESYLREIETRIQELVPHQHT